MEMPTQPASEKGLFPTRQKRLSEALNRADLQGLALNPGPSLTYLTGLHFHLSERPVVAIFTPEQAVVMVLPELEKAKLASLDYPVQSFVYGEDPTSWGEVFAQGVRVARLDGKTIGLEPQRMRVLELELLQEASRQTRFVSAAEALAGLRMFKDAAEASAMRKAVKIAQDALQAALPAVRIGMTEREFASELTLQLLRHGSDAELPFSPIVSGGPNSANPHAMPSIRPFQPGDLLVIDWGAAYGGYISDLTRTFAIGEVDPQLQKIADCVVKANTAGREACRPGAPVESIDHAARGVIETVHFDDSDSSAHLGRLAEGDAGDIGVGHIIALDRAVIEQYTVGKPFGLPQDFRRDFAHFQVDG